ncbi:MAG: hypothetical protein HZY76_07265 [Anaerolineae bacterium]|nr:MAG: hypothetical protein HZY76_07265 [Anaerolineae bacterium]
MPKFAVGPAVQRGILGVGVPVVRLLQHQRLQRGRGCRHSLPHNRRQVPGPGGGVAVAVAVGVGDGRGVDVGVAVGVAVACGPDGQSMARA